MFNDRKSPDDQQGEPPTNHTAPIEKIRVAGNGQRHADCDDLGVLAAEKYGEHRPPDELDDPSCDDLPEGDHRPAPAQGAEGGINGQPRRRGVLRSGEFFGPLAGEALASMYLRDRARHALSWGAVHTYDGGRYVAPLEPHFRASVRDAIAAHAEKLNELAIKQPTASDKRSGPKLHDVTKGMVDNTIDAIKSMISPVENGPPVWLEPSSYSQNCLSMANGILDVDRLIDGDPQPLAKPSDSFFTLVRIPYCFIPNATCPMWHKFLERNFEGDAERIAAIQEFFGYCLLGDTTFHKFLLLTGEGSNGKSVFCTVLSGMLGDDNVSSVPLEVFGERFQLNATLGKLANICAEVGEIDKAAEGHIKAFVSGDPMTFDRKHREPIVARPTAKLVVACNTLPRISDRSQGLWRRIILMPCNVEIGEEEKIIGMDRPKYWSDEFPGVLNWAIEGRRRLRQQGHFTESTLCNEAKEKYRDEVNPVRNYLRENHHARKGSAVKCADAYRGYRDWCDATGHKALGDDQFGKEIRRLFPSAIRKQGPRELGGHRPRFYFELGNGPDPSKDSEPADEPEGF
ncbi:MAG TPA: phage/plasmid primase, P4 family [Planctomycetaceae bacterium]|jgi:P4 family phage/plasmid primase-like protien|nr:phage/plasmid primase, P4 family [Planctomycetaceae bacterium]